MKAGDDDADDEELPVAETLPADVLAELAKIVLAEETLDTVLSKMVEMAKRVIVPADEVSLTMVRKGRAETAAHTGVLAMHADERQYGLGAGPCLDSARGGELLYVRDMRSETRWPEYAPQAVRIGVLSSLSVPLPIQEDLVGALNVYSRSANAFGVEDIRAGEAFAAYAAVAVSNADSFASSAEMADNLRIAMASRATIEQAKGILMARGGVSPDQAFDMLVRASQRENRKLRDVATEVVERARLSAPRASAPLRQRESGAG